MMKDDLHWGRHRILEGYGGEIFWVALYNATRGYNVSIKYQNGIFLGMEQGASAGPKAGNNMTSLIRDEIEWEIARFKHWENRCD